MAAIHHGRVHGRTHLTPGWGSWDGVGTVQGCGFVLTTLQLQLGHQHLSGYPGCSLQDVALCGGVQENTSGSGPIHRSALMHALIAAAFKVAHMGSV